MKECQVFHDRRFMRLSLMAEHQSVVDLQRIGNDLETRMRQVLDEREMPEELRNLLLTCLDIVKKDLAGLKSAAPSAGSYPGARERADGGMGARQLAA